MKTIDKGQFEEIEKLLTPSYLRSFESNSFLLSMKVRSYKNYIICKGRGRVKLSTNSDGTEAKDSLKRSHWDVKGTC